LSGSTHGPLCIGLFWIRNKCFNLPCFKGWLGGITCVKKSKFWYEADEYLLASGIVEHLKSVSSTNPAPSGSEPDPVPSSFLQMVFDDRHDCPHQTDSGVHGACHLLEMSFLLLNSKHFITGITDHDPLAQLNSEQKRIYTVNSH
jgi:hypothetical protein